MDNTHDSLLDSLLNDPSFAHWAKNSRKEDVALWNQWIQDHPQHLDTVYTAKAILLGIQFKEVTLDDGVVEQEFGKLLGSLQLQDTTPSPKTWIKRRTVLAMGTLAAFALLFAFLYTTKEESSLIEHKTGYGMIMDLTLPDGTSVTLNGNSRMSYDKNNPRDIQLEGEAYFNVQKIPSTNAKFWVTTNDLRIAVYGTQFHVNTRDQKTDVMLDEGSIHLLLDNGQTKQMEVGEMVSYASGSQTFEQRKLSKRDSYSVWRKGTFEFNNLSFQKVMHHLGETYGIKYRFTDTATEEMAISGGIPNQNLQLCIQALEKATHTRMVMDNDTLVIFTNLK